MSLEQISTLVFSKSRPAQLDLALRTFQKHCKYSGEIYVSCNITPEYQSGYDLVQKYQNDEYEYPACLCKRKSLKDDILEICQESEYTMFMTDDDIFYRDTFPEELVTSLFQYHEFDAFFNRLGLNTYVQNPMNRNERVIFPDFTDCEYEDGTKVLLWDMRRVPNWTNFGYNFSVDCTVYRSSDLINYFNYNEVDFGTPNFFEGSVTNKIDIKIAGCSKQSCVFGAPVNRVQNEFQNGAGKSHPLSPEYANEQFLLGKRLYPKFTEDIIGAHQEIELEFK